MQHSRSTTQTKRVVQPDGYPEELELGVKTADGLTFSVRPIRPDDADRLVTFHEGLSMRSCYLRFFTYHPHLSAAEVARFTSVDYANRLALVAVVDDALIGVARFDRAVGTSEAEVAFVVGDDYQRRGIASFLLDELISAGRSRGIETFLANTLVENRAMQDVFWQCGFPIERHGEYDTLSLRFPITGSSGWEDARANRRRGWTMRPMTHVGTTPDPPAGAETMYVTVLQSALKAWTDDPEGSAFIDYVVRCRNALQEEGPLRKRSPYSSVVTDITYDRALIHLARQLGLDVVPTDFSYPERGRRQVEQLLAHAGVDLVALSKAEGTRHRVTASL